MAVKVHALAKALPPLSLVTVLISVSVGPPGSSLLIVQVALSPKAKAID